MNITTKSDYLLLFRGNVWDRGLSPAQLQQVVSDWMAWFERLKAEGKCSGGHVVGYVADVPFDEMQRRMTEPAMVEAMQYVQQTLVDELRG